MKSPHHVHLKPIGGVLRDAWDIYRKHMNVLALVSVIPLIFAGIKLIFHPELAANHGAWVGMVVVIALFSLLNLFFSLVMPLATISTIEAVKHGRTLDANAAYHKAFALALPYLFIVLLNLLIVVGGSILFVIPGIIASVYLMFVVYVFLFEGKHGLDALLQSAWYARGVWIDLFLRKLTIGVITVASVLVFAMVVGILSVFAGFDAQVFSFIVDLFLFIFIVPFSLCFGYVVYSDVKQAKSHMVHDAAFMIEAERILITLLLITVIAALIVFFAFNLTPHHLVSNGMMIHHISPHGFMGN